MNEPDLVLFTPQRPVLVGRHDLYPGPLEFTSAFRSEVSVQRPFLSAACGGMISARHEGALDQTARDCQGSRVRFSYALSRLTRTLQPESCGNNSTGYLSGVPQLPAPKHARH